MLLDHAQVAGFGCHRARIAHLPGQLQPLRHPAAGLRELTAYLGGDAEHMQSAGASALVARPINDVGSLEAQGPSVLDVPAQLHPGQAGEREPGRGRLAQPVGEAAAALMQSQGGVILAAPEGE